MVKKYKAMRIPADVYSDVHKKKLKMDSVATQLTGKTQNIPLTKVMRVLANQPLRLSDVELIKVVKVGRRKK